MFVKIVHIHRGQCWPITRCPLHKMVCKIGMEWRSTGRKKKNYPNFSWDFHVLLKYIQILRFTGIILWTLQSQSIRKTVLQREKYLPGEHLRVKLERLYAKAYRMEENPENFHRAAQNQNRAHTFVKTVTKVRIP